MLKIDFRVKGLHFNKSWKLKVLWILNTDLVKLTNNCMDWIYYLLCIWLAVNILTCRRFLLPVSVHERAACPGNCLIHPPPPPTNHNNFYWLLWSHDNRSANHWLKLDSCHLSFSMESDIVAQYLQRNAISS